MGGLVPGVEQWTCRYCGYNSLFTPEDLKHNFKRANLRRIKKDPRHKCLQCHNDGVTLQNPVVTDEERIEVVRLMAADHIARRVWGWEHIAGLTDEEILAHVGERRSATAVRKEIAKVVKCRKEAFKDKLFLDYVREARASGEDLGL